MTSNEKDPTSGVPLRAEWDNSEITIYDVPGILEDAAADTTVIYDRSDFPHPIERVQVTAEMRYTESEPALALESLLQLDRTRRWNTPGIINRFAQFLAPQKERRRNYQKRPPFRIIPSTFAGTHLMADEETGSTFLLWVVPSTGQLTITNNKYLVSQDDEKKKYELAITPPAMHTISSENQLTSLMKATALVADFVNAFQIPLKSMRNKSSIPLHKNYVVGQERRPADKSRVTKSLGQTGVKSTSNNSAPKNPASNKEHDIEKIKPEDAIRLSDVGGLESVKKTLQEIATSFSHFEIMKKWGAERPTGVLLYGDPGTGKTMLTQALANEIGAEMWAIQSTDIYESWLGNSEQRIKDIFNRALRAKKPLILMFDEFESIVGITGKSSAGGADNARNAVAGIFKQEMNTLAKENPNVLVVAATNNLDAIDPSLVRPGRFDHKIYVPMPDQEGRQEIIVNIMSKAILGVEEGTFKIFGENINPGALAIQTDGFSGADIAEVFRRLSLSRAMKEARTSQAQNPITQTDIEQAIQGFRTGD